MDTYEEIRAEYDNGIISREEYERRCSVIGVDA
jgi:hypothetical protein